ncbi:MAG: DUF3352 domain-containing protein, partial [Verrucomicrobiaceae bacterium]|nr:DUF3352 domain-containing protein [Verrucomicrobiaceae bacterium]
MMKRFSLLVLASLVGAAAIWYGIRVAQKSSPEAVAALAPRDAMIFAHLPDLNRSRNAWRGLEISKLYHEPAVQELVRGPLSRLQQVTPSQTLDELRVLDPKDVFVAVTSVDQVKFVGGFHAKRRKS